MNSLFRVPNCSTVSDGTVFFMTEIPKGSWVPSGCTPVVINLNKFVSGQLMARVAAIAAAGSTCDEQSLDATDRYASNKLFNGLRSSTSALKLTNCSLRRNSKSSYERALIFCTQNSKSLGSSRGASKGESARTPSAKCSSGDRPVGIAFIGGIAASAFL